MQFKDPNCEDCPIFKLFRQALKDQLSVFNLKEWIMLYLRVARKDKREK